MYQVLRRIKFKVDSNKYKGAIVSIYMSKNGLKRTIKPALFFTIAVLFFTSILQIILPVRPYQPYVMVKRPVKIIENQQQLGKSETQVKMIHPIRSGLFKPSRGVRVNSITDKTVEKIFNSLKLQCVMPIGGQKVAYIVLKDGQMRKCKVGETVKDMFTVIDVQDDSVTVDILGHKLSLNK